MCITFLVISQLFIFLINSQNLNQAIQNNYLLLGNFTGNQDYVAIMTSESQKNGNFFHYKSLSTNTPYFINAITFSNNSGDINVVNTTTSLDLVTTRMSNRGNLPNKYFFCTRIEYYTSSLSQDCINNPDDSLCSCLASANIMIKLNQTINCTTSNSVFCRCIKDNLSGMSTPNLVSSNLTCNHTNLSEDPSCTNNCYEIDTRAYKQYDAYFDIAISIGDFKIPPLENCILDTFSVYFLKFYRSSSTDFAISAYSQRFWDYPVIGTPYNFNSSFFTLPNSFSDYNTIIKTQLVYHNFTTKLFCKYNLTYTGVIRFVSINDYRGFPHNQPGFDGFSQHTNVISEFRFLLRPGVLNFVVIMGYDIEFTDINFVNCLTRDFDTSTPEVFPEFQYFYYNETVFPTNNLAGSRVCSCQSGCATCLDSSNCLRCDSSNYQFDKRCISMATGTCPSNSTFRSVMKCSRNPPSYNTFTSSSNVGNNFSFTGYLDHPNFSYFVITFHATDSVITSYYNLTWVNLSSPAGIAMSSSAYIRAHTGFYNFSVILNLNGISSQGYNMSNYVIYPVNRSAYYSLGVSIWRYSVPIFNLTQLRSISQLSLSKENKFSYNNASFTYVYEFYFRCFSTCYLFIETDGNSYAYLNDRILLYSINFIEKWTYQINLNSTDLNRIKIINTNTFYFSFQVQGIYEIYQPYYPVSSDLIFLPTDLSTSCTITNCASCYNSICLSCMPGYFLSSSALSCDLNCGSDLHYRTEMKCYTSCPNNTIQLNSTDCTPLCVEPGQYYNPQTGYSICVEECGICSDTDTCLSCRYPSDSSTDTFCFRKSGDLFTLSPDFNTSQQVYIIGDFSLNYTAIITDQATYHDNMFYFTKDQDLIPRILLATKIEAVNSSYGSLNLPRIDVSQSGTITIHYLIIRPILTKMEFSIAAFEDVTLLTFSKNLTDPILTPLTSELNYLNLDFLPKDSESYTTIVLTRIYEHTYIDDMQCNFQIIFTGHIRGFYANGELIYFDSQKTGAQSKKSGFTRYFSFKKNEIVLITLFVYNFFIDDLKINDCMASNGSTLELNSLGIQASIIVINDAFPNNFYIQNNTYCPDECNQCHNFNTCTSCKSGFYLLNGKCQKYCDTTLPYYGSNGYCLNSLQRTSYRGTISSYFSSNTFNYVWILPSDNDLDFIWYTTGGFLGPSNFKILHENSDWQSLTESQFKIFSYRRSAINYSGSQNLLYATTNSDQSLTTSLYTIKYNSILLYYYDLTNSPQVLTNANGFEYVDFSNKSFTLQTSFEYRFKFFVTSVYQISLTFNTDGYVKILRNDRTILFEGFKDSYLSSVTLLRSLSGTNLLTFVISSSSFFQYSFNDSYSIYTFDEMISYDYFNVSSSSSCSISNCLNCNSRTCFSCRINANFFLNDSNCTIFCPTNSLSISGQWLCTSSTSCANLGLVRLRNRCVYNCTTGFYWKRDTGCSGTCHPTCLSCGGANSFDCFSCRWPFIYDSSNNRCLCPPGSVLNGSICSSVSTITLSLASAVQSCSVNQMQAIIDLTEAATYNFTFKWNLKSSTSSSQTIQNIENYLLGSNSRILFLPSGLLATGQSYNFSVEYVNAVNTTIIGWAVTVTSLDAYPNVAVDGGNVQNVSNGIENIISLVATYSACLSLNTQLSVSWTYVSGHVLDPSQFFNPSTPLYLTISKCTLSPNIETNFLGKVWMTPTPLYSTPINLKIKTLPESFSAIILKGNRMHPAQNNLTVNAQIVYSSDCTPDTGIILYTWFCLYQNSSLCFDPTGIYNSSTNSSYIIIPERTFNEGDILNLSLIISKNGQDAQGNAQITISPSNYLSISITCTSCSHFSLNGQNYFFDVELLSSANKSNMTFKWYVTPLLNFTLYGSLIKILNPGYLPSDVQYIKLEVNASNGTNYGYTFLNIPVNQPPKDGNLIVYPMTGYSFSTYFTLTANFWTDEDIPIKYQFYYSFSATDNFISLLTDYQVQSSTSTYLPGQSANSIIYVLLSVKDIYSAFSTVTTSLVVQSQFTSLSETVDTFLDLTKTLADSDPFQKAKTLSMMTAELTSWEEKLNATLGSTKGCPLCSGHGTCTSSLCVCNSGWTYLDCSITEAVFSQIISLKVEILQNIQDTYESLPTEALKKTLYDTMQNIPQNEAFNNNQTLLKIQDILENTLKITDPNTTLTASESVSVSVILSDLLSYSSKYDCKGQTNYTNTTTKKVSNYLDAITKGLLSDKLPNETAVVLTTDTYELLVQRLSICDLGSLKLDLGAQVPKITLNQDTSSFDCNLIINLQAYAFDSNLMSCNNSANPSYTSVGVKITDGNGNSIKLNGTVSIGYNSGDLQKYCKSPCTITNAYCLCNDISLLDVASQIKNIFYSSSITKLDNFNNLSQLRFVDNIIFIAMLVFTCWLVVSIFIVKFLIPDYDIVQSFIEERTSTQNIGKKISKLSIFWISYICVHPMLNSYFIKRYKHLSKFARCLFFYGRSILIMTFTSLFGTAGANDKDLIGRVMNFQLYLFFLPYFTIFPLEDLLEWSLENPIDEKASRIGFSDGRANFRKNWSRKFKIGFFLNILIISGCFLTNMIIASVADENQIIQWTGDFIKSIVQDQFITPVIYLIFQLGMIKIYKIEKLKTMKITHKIIRSRVNTALLSFYDFTKKHKQVQDEESKKADLSLINRELSINKTLSEFTNPDTSRPLNNERIKDYELQESLKKQLNPKRNISPPIGDFYLEPKLKSPEKGKNNLWIDSLLTSEFYTSNALTANTHKNEEMITKDNIRGLNSSEIQAITPILSSDKTMKNAKSKLLSVDTAKKALEGSSYSYNFFEKEKDKIMTEIANQIANTPQKIERSSKKTQTLRVKLSNEEQQIITTTNSVRSEKKSKTLIFDKPIKSLDPSPVNSIRSNRNRSEDTPKDLFNDYLKITKNNIKKLSNDDNSIESVHNDIGLNFEKSKIISRRKSRQEDQKPEEKFEEFEKISIADIRRLRHKKSNSTLFHDLDNLDSAIPSLILDDSKVEQKSNDNNIL